MSAIYKVITKGQIEYSTTDANDAARRAMQLATSGTPAEVVTQKELMKRAPAIFVTIPGTAGDKYVKANKGEFVREVMAYGGVLETEFHIAKDGSLFI
jgi:hypothetical protein